MADLERIWLQHPDDAAPEVGRLWCQDKVWPNDPEDGEPTEYVRADLLAEARKQIAAKDAALRACFTILDNMREGDPGIDGFWEALDLADAALAAPARKDEPLSDEDQRMIDKAWENYQKAAATKPARGTGE